MVRVVAVLAALLAACGGGDLPPAAAPTPTATGNFLADALADLPDCPPAPQPTPTSDIAGLHLPDEAVITSVRETGPLTQVQGFLAMTPLELREYYEGDGGNGLELLHVEDEGFESELLFSDGDNRMFVKAQALCNEGSNMVAVVAPEDNAEAVPVPSGSPAPAAGG